MGTYAVIGRGATTPKEVIVAGLKDSLKEGDSVKVAWGGATMSRDEGTLWDYLLDFEVPTILLYEDGDTVLPLLKGLEHVEIRKTRNKLVSTVSDVDQVLLMWGEDQETEDMLMHSFSVTGEEASYLELTNGLEPIILVDEEDVVVPQESPSSEVVVEDSEPDDDRSFTKLELDTMTAHAVKRYGARIGAAGTTKSSIIAELFPDSGGPMSGASIMGTGPAQEPDEVVKEALEAVGIKPTPAPHVNESIVDEALKPLRDLLLLLASTSNATIEVLEGQGMLDEGDK